MNPVVAQSWQRMEEARGILDRANTWRAGLPDAWCRALMHLKREVHIPIYARTDWAFLSNEMGRSIESRPGNSGMQFMEGISETEVRDMYYAFKRVYCCVFYIAMRVTAKPICSACEVPADHAQDAVDLLDISISNPDARMH